MKLFDVIPERFFHLLTGLNKELYAEAALLLYEHAQQSRFGIRLEVLRDLFQELIETQRDLGQEMQTEGDDGDGEELGFLGSESSQLNWEDMSRQQANALLRRMERLGWMNLELRDQFETYVVLPHYANRTLNLLYDLCQDRAVEYQRYAFLAYQLLSGEEAKRRPSFAVREALQVSMEFERELTTLYQNMKHHMEQVVRQTTLEDVLNHHFDVYKAQIVDKSYHRLKTSDHVSRYRFHILHTVQQWLLDKELLAETVLDGIKNELYASPEEGEEDLREALLRIEDTFNGLDDIIYQIDLRHNQYLRASYDRARYLTSHNQGLDKQLAHMLEQLSESLRKDSSGDRYSGLSLFRLQEIRALTEQSLLAPRTKRAPHEPEMHEVVPISDELREQLKRDNLDRLRRAVTRKKVDDYVLMRLAYRSEMEVKELAPNTVEEFLMLTYVYLYGQDGGSKFRLRRSESRILLQVGPYSFTNHVIIRSGKGARV